MRPHARPPTGPGTVAGTVAADRHPLSLNASRISRVARVAPTLWLTLGILLATPACKRSIVIRGSDESARPHRAILVLPGLVGDQSSWDALGDFFSGRGADLLLPDYISRRGVNASAENLEDFLDAVDIQRYDEVHVFAFILGGWVLNTLLQTYPFENLRSIVYDRSPLQERASSILMEEIPGLISLLTGDTVRSLRDTPYPQLNRSGIPVGILVETRATPLVRAFREEVLAMGPIDWSVPALGQPFNDHAYVPLDHHDMYRRVDTFGEEVLRFFETGSFSDHVRRSPPTSAEVWEKRPPGPLAPERRRVPVSARRGAVVR